MLKELEQSAIGSAERAELTRACDELQAAHQELIFFERRLVHAREGFETAAIRFFHAGRRIELLLKELNKGILQLNKSANAEEESRHE